jgi:hypothetical protein
MKLILKPTVEEIEAAEKTGNKYYFVKRYNLWSYWYYPANRSGLIIQMAPLGISLFLFAYFQQKISNTYFFLSILFIINVSWVFSHYKSYPTNKRISRYNNLSTEEMDSVYKANRLIDELYNKNVPSNLKIENSEPAPKATFLGKKLIVFIVLATIGILVIFVVILLTDFNNNQLSENQIDELLKRN